MRHGSVRLTHLPLETAEIQLAFALGRSFGNAVERNRGRRRLRAAFIEVVSRVEQDEAFESAELHGAFLLTGSRGLLTNDFARLIGDVEACLTKLPRRSDMKSNTST